jgi:hypothetical protein
MRADNDGSLREDEIGAVINPPEIKRVPRLEKSSEVVDDLSLRIIWVGLEDEKVNLLVHCTTPFTFVTVLRRKLTAIDPTIP